MLRIQMIGLALVAALAMTAVAASSASAAHLWLVGGKLVASPVKVHSQGLLLLTDHNPLGNTSLETVLHCKGFDDGTVGPHALDLVLAVTKELLGTEPRITCTFDKAGGCESSPAPLALAVNLPWHTELYLVGTEVRDMVVSDVAGKKAGWKVVCKAPLLGTITDECTATLGSVKVENVAAGVLGTFEEKSENADCKVGTEAERKGAGLVRGTTLFESPSGAAGDKLTFD
jgi:hypothetical protein